MQDLGTTRLKFEIFIDDDMAQAVHGHVPWLQDAYEGWRCPGLEPTLFKDGLVPMKEWTSDHRVALKYFALAHRAGNAKLPQYLLQGSLPAADAYQHLLEGTIVPVPHQATIGFKLLMNSTNYPRLKWEDPIEFPEHVAEEMLNAGRKLLESP